MGNPPAYDMYENKPRPEINWNISNGDWVGIWGYDWANIIGNEVLKVTSEIDYEVWQPDYRANQVYKHEFENRLVHILFPASKVNGQLFSNEIIKYIERLKENNNVILKIGRAKTLMSELILNKFSPYLPIINMYFGNLSSVNLKYGRNPIKWIKTYRRWKSELSHLNKQRYISIGEYLPGEGRFKEVFIKSNQLLLHHSIGIDEKFFNEQNDKFETREKLGLPVEKKIFLSSSRLNPLKQIDKLINTFSQVESNDFILLITGAGTKEYSNYLKSLIKNQNKDIRFLDYLSDDELLLYYQAADYFVDASMNDGGPMSAWKAIAMGIPVITTATGNVGVFLKRNNAGLRIPVNMYKQWETIFTDVISDTIQIKTIDKDIVESFISWESSTKRNIANYYKVIEDFYEK